MPSRISSSGWFEDLPSGDGNGWLFGVCVVALLLRMEI